MFSAFTKMSLWQIVYQGIRINSCGKSSTKKEYILFIQDDTFPDLSDLKI